MMEYLRDLLPDTMVIHAGHTTRLRRPKGQASPDLNCSHAH